ncbi:MAG TPA: hypothetical protein GX746_00740 [Bacteroidales bacterium]|nr:hypothetical protein [Bacteroidales bacterium]
MHLPTGEHQLEIGMCAKTVENGSNELFMSHLPRSFRVSGVGKQSTTVDALINVSINLPQ